VCGIVAMLSARGPIDSARVDRAREALAHRGPDGAGTFFTRDRTLALAHRRLAIVDPQGGAQPLANEDGSIIATCSGEVYEHERIRADLERAGHRFATRSDSEVLVHLYEEEGIDFVPRLRGELAFALWDDRTRRLFVARDRFGIRPVVWTIHEGVLHVASEVKALFAAGVPRRWDEASLFVAASVQYTLPDRTLFAGIHTLPPGCLLVAAIEDERVEVEVRRYADLDYPIEGRERVSSREAVRDVLRDAVRLRIESTSPVAFHLSGGLDSTAVLALAKEAGVSRPQAFTLAFDDPAYDERAIAERTCALLGASISFVDASSSTLLDVLPRAIVQGEGLAINGHIAAKHLLSRAIAAGGFKVALSGEGADETFAGYAHLRRDLQIGLRGANAVSLGTMLPTGEPTLPLDAIARTLGSVPTFLEAKAALGAKLHLLLDPAWRNQQAEIAHGDPMNAVLASVDVEGQLHGRAPIHRALYLWTRLALATYILRTLGDAMDLAHAVEVRLPFLDGEVFALARDLPAELLVNGGREKYILREALAGIVPEHVLVREKHPLLAPLVVTSPEARPFVGDVLAHAPPFFDRKAIARLVDRLPTLPPEKRVVEEPVVMMVLSASILGAHYGLSA
jgi:asparagine synthase (glutamine-hydrolysing)